MIDEITVKNIISAELLSTVNWTQLGTKIAIVIGIAILAKIIARSVGFISRKFDELIDHVFKLDFSESFHKTIERVSGRFIWMFAAYLVFKVFEIANPLQNSLFQVIVFAVVCKMLLDSIPPVVEGIENKVEGKKISKHTRVLFEKAFSYSLYAIFVIGTLYILGYTDLFAAALTGAGVLGVALGFASKQTVANVFAGLTIILDKPFKIGDSVKLGDRRGTVKDIRLRSTWLRTFDNKQLMIPNTYLSNRPVINYSRAKTRRVDIPVGISYESDVKKAFEVIPKELKETDGIMPNKEIKVMLDELGDSAVILNVRCWVDAKDRDGYRGNRSDAIEAIKKSLDDAGIKIPFPIMTVINKSD